MILVTFTSGFSITLLLASFIGIERKWRRKTSGLASDLTAAAICCFAALGFRAAKAQKFHQYI